jgi:hypothetical protein
MDSAAKTKKIRLSRPSPSYCRVTFDHPPLNLVDPNFILEFREIVTSLEGDEQVKVVVFDSAVDGFLLNHSDFLAKLEDLTNISPREGNSVAVGSGRGLSRRRRTHGSASAAHR